MTIIAICLLGCCGVLLRYAIDVWCIQFQTVLPIGTLLINLTGSFLAGLIYSLEIHPSLKTGLLVGFCGGLTTFSAYTLQSHLMILKQGSLWAILYLFSSPTLGLAMAILGVGLGRFLKSA